MIASKSEKIWDRLKYRLKQHNKSKPFQTLWCLRAFLKCLIRVQNYSRFFLAGVWGGTECHRAKSVRQRGRSDIRDGRQQRYLSVADTLGIFLYTTRYKNISFTSRGCSDHYTSLYFTDFSIMYVMSVYMIRCPSFNDLHFSKNTSLAYEYYSFLTINFLFPLFLPLALCAQLFAKEPISATAVHPFLDC